MWRGIIIWSIPPMPKWLPVILSLYAMSSLADIISPLLAHGMIIGRGMTDKVTANPSSTVLAAQTEGCTNPNCKAKKHSTHTMANCYWPGGGKERQFPPNFGQRNRANAVTSLSTTTSTWPEYFVLLACNLDTPRQSGVLIDNAHDDSPRAVLYTAPPISPESTGLQQVCQTLEQKPSISAGVHFFCLSLPESTRLQQTPASSNCYASNCLAATS